MKRVILDTNIYGEIIINKDIELIKSLTRNKLLVYGLSIVRKELKQTPKTIKIDHENKKRKLQIILLELYDFLVKNRFLELSGFIEKLSSDYYIVYREIGGNLSKQEMQNDFLIVACASIYHIEVVYSGDNRTMLSKKAIEAYNIVNKINGLKNPEFKNYEVFKKDVIN